MMSATRPPGYSQRTTMVSPRLLAPRKRPGRPAEVPVAGRPIWRGLAAAAPVAPVGSILGEAAAALLPRLGAVAAILRGRGQGRGGEQGGEDVNRHPGHGRRSRPQALNDG